jgi:hypothetical protein
VGRRNDILVTGNENEIYGHFTCDAEVEQFQWTRAQPPFSFLSLTAVDESSTFRDPFFAAFYIGCSCRVLSRQAIRRACRFHQDGRIVFGDLRVTSQKSGRPKNRAPHMRRRAAIETQAFFRLFEIASDNVDEVVKDDLGVWIE